MPLFGDNPQYVTMEVASRGGTLRCAEVRRVAYRELISPTLPID